MAETQLTISDWANETFGPAGSNARVAAQGFEPLPIGTALQRYWMERLPAGEAAMLWNPDRAIPERR